MTKPEYAVKVEQVHKSFGANEVLKGISFSARQGDVLAIIGASGSGKSTLLRCINHLVVPDEGRIYIGNEVLLSRKRRDGVAVSSDPRQLERVRAKLGMVFQNFNLWTHRTVLQNVIEGPVHVQHIAKHEAIDHALTLLAKVGLSDKQHAYPAELSGGQQQRVAIARALAMNPEVLLFDEPTSALDPEMVGEVLRVIRTLADEGRSMILVTHEMKFAREVSDQTIFLHEGIVEESGVPEALFDNPVSDRLRQFLQPMC
ncbi:ATP-binding cassette domain-containing protein [Pollutimonas bauzanensis]|jgi:ABC-type histidine transport system ATPase subunit|uniref:ABC transporter ATP-binding protein n=1 Tax=Pollutimonas bauzanensis TaxID=658167 RepID=UPI00333FD677